MVHLLDENGNLCKSYLDNVLFVPSYPQNIFSVRSAAEKGARVHLSADSGNLISKDGKKFPIRTIGNLYYDIIMMGRHRNQARECRTCPFVLIQLKPKSTSFFIARYTIN